MDYISLIFYFLIIIPSSIIHEYAHGWVADRLGDPTARYAGRLSINPLVHIDLWGTILLPVGLYLISQGQFLFAYAKPVPFNPYNLKPRTWGPALVGLAGPLANLLLALVFSLVLKLFPIGSVWSFFIGIIVYANIGLMIFNLIPIPPLDGSKVLFAVLPDSFRSLKILLERYGFVILIFFVFSLFQYVTPLIEWIASFLIQGSGSVL